MPYDPYLWKDSKAGGTPITAARLNAIEQGLDQVADISDAATTSAAAAYALADNARGVANSASTLASANKAALDALGPAVNRVLYTALNVMDFGAVGDGATDDRAAIQSAIDQAANAYVSTGTPQEVYLPGLTFIVGVTPYYRTAGNAYGICSLVLKSGVRLRGPGTLKVKAGSRGPGALYAVIKSTATGITNAGIYDISIDGNRANNTSTDQSSNIVLHVSSNVTIDNINSYNADGEGIQVVGPLTDNTLQANDIKITNNRVYNCDRLGIQVTRFRNLLISGNTVTYCGGNCIDIYGDGGSGSSSNGTNFIISNNILRNGANGVFPETVASGIISNNRITDCTEAGMHINRIYSEPNNILIEGNSIYSNPIGIIFTGDTGGVFVRGNDIQRSSTAGIQVGGGGANTSSIYIMDNFIQNVNLNGNPLILYTGRQVANCRSRGNITRNTDRGWDNVFYNLDSSSNNITSPFNAS